MAYRAKAAKLTKIMRLSNQLLGVVQPLKLSCCYMKQKLYILYRKLIFISMINIQLYIARGI